MLSTSSASLATILTRFLCKPDTFHISKHYLLGKHVSKCSLQGENLHQQKLSIVESTINNSTIKGITIKINLFAGSKYMYLLVAKVTYLALTKHGGNMTALLTPIVRSVTKKNLVKSIDNAFDRMKLCTVIYPEELSR